MQIDFGAAFDRVNHLGILYKLCSVGIGGSVLSILTQFLSNRSQQVMVDDCQSKLVNVCRLTNSLSIILLKDLYIKSSTVNIYVYDCHINHVYIYIYMYQLTNNIVTCNFTILFHVVLHI